MKTTVEIDDELLKAAKKAAIDEGVTLREFLEKALRARLEPGALAGIYAGFETRGALHEEGTFQILDDLELAAREYQEHLRERAS
jgi:Arc/MetJ family transcription regulator